MTVGSPLRAIIKFAIPLILGYILQQMYLIIDAAIVGRWIGVDGCLLRRPSSVGHGRSLPHSRLPVAL